MSIKRFIDPQFDLFIHSIIDLPLRDQRETMERPFFSLSKRKRLTSINYERLVRLLQRPRRHPRAARRRPDGRPPRPAVDASRLRQPQTLGTRHLPRPAPQAPAILSRRIRLSLQPPPHPARRLPLPPRHRRRQNASPTTS